MAIIFLQPDGVAITAAQFRQGQAATHGAGAGKPLGGRSGLRVDTPSDVLTATSTTWTLKQCAAMIDPGASTTQGMYGWATDTVITGNVTAADATNGRKDIVYIQVNDSSAGDGSGATSAPVQYLAGVPSATPAAPALPARSFLLGTITVPKAGAGSPTVVVNPARYVAAGAFLPVVSDADRDAISKYDGLGVLRMDVAGRPFEIWDGAAWNRFAKAPVSAEAAGSAALGIVAANTNAGPFNQSFPAGRFTQPPIVIPTTDQSRVIAVAANITVNGFDLYLTNVTSGASGNGQLRWFAKQMTPTSAAG